MRLVALLKDTKISPSDRLAVFALLCLGVIESVANGLLNVADAVRLFFHADNCLFVRRQLRDKSADEIMGRGVQLQDLVELLQGTEAKRELQSELTAMRSLCFKLLKRKKSVA